MSPSRTPMANGSKFIRSRRSTIRSPPTDAANVVFDSTIRYDASFFASLDRIIQSEPWLPRDRAMIDVLRSLGIEKGKPFLTATPRLPLRRASARRTLGSKADTKPVSRHSTRTAAGRCRPYPNSSPPCGRTSMIPTNTRWMPAGSPIPSPIIGIKRLGAGQFYLISIKDKDGNAFDGGKTYRLTVPANPPVEQYWSATAYDRATHAL